VRCPGAIRPANLGTNAPRSGSGLVWDTASYSMYSPWCATVPGVRFGVRLGVRVRVNGRRKVRVTVRGKLEG
jgi:hypothetical protein